MRVHLPYGRSRIEVELPNHAKVTWVRKRAMPLLENPDSAVEKALAPLEVIGPNSTTACILVCDITRPVPNGTFLPVLIRNLQRARIKSENITILIATGLHRPNIGEELSEILGDSSIVDQVHVVNHNARNDDDHVDMGRTRSGTPVLIDRRFIEADLKIATGLVEPHFMAGYSGGRKVVAPGVAHEHTIRTFHSARFMEHPSAKQCQLEGNPLHLEQLEIIDMIRSRCANEIYALNTVIDDQRRLSFVNFGEIEQSHMEAVEFAREYLTVEVPNRFGTVLSSSAGFPLDQTYYQTVKSMVTPLDILKDNATLVVASECAEGLGSESFRNSQRNLLHEGPDEFMCRITGKALADIDEWETEMQLKAQRRVRIKLFSDRLEGDDRTLTCVDMIESIHDAIYDSIERSGDNRLAVIEEGPYVVPIYNAYTEPKG